MQGGLAKDCIHNTLWLIPILFGLKGILANFQHLMDKLLRGVESYAVAYLDDLIIYSTTWDQHLVDIQLMLERLVSWADSQTQEVPICDATVHVGSLARLGQKWNREHGNWS